MLEKALLEMVRHAYRTTPYYRDRLREAGMTVEKLQTMEDFQRLPPVDRAEIQENPSAFLSETYLRFPLKEKISLLRTSGSTGRYLKLHWHEDDLTRSLMSLWLMRRKQYGIHPGDPYCYFYTTSYQSNKLVEEKEEQRSPLGRSLGFSKNGLNRERLLEIYRGILEFQPRWMMLQPTVAQLLARCAVENGLPRPERLAYIELSGETLFAPVREEIERFFGCHVVNQYGCMEVNCVAFECKDKRLHLLPGNAYLEVLRDGVPAKDGEAGELYVTSLHNHAMPFVRYKTGDRGILRREGCTCGGGRPVLELLSGRVGDFVLLADGTRLPSYLFLRPVEHINERIGNIIRQFQVVQTGIGQFTVRLSVHPSYLGWKDTIRELFLEHLKQPELADADWRFEFFDALLPDERNGKLAFFYNELSKPEQEEATSL